MQIRLFTLALLIFLQSCKLMPRNEAVNAEKSNPMNGPFMTPAWVSQTTIYEVNLRQYTPAGTFNAFLLELPRLKELGVETLWFMPLTPIAQLNKKIAPILSIFLILFKIYISHFLKNFIIPLLPPVPQVYMV